MPTKLGGFWDGLKVQPVGTAETRSGNRGDPDRLREGLVRYLGYANEVGESFRPLVPRTAVNASYGVAGVYVAADAAWRGGIPPPGRSSFVEACDTLLWQGLASVAVPGFVINRVVWAVGRVGPPQFRAWLPTAAGLCSIPLIIRPIDHGIDVLMDTLVRPLYGDRRSRKKE
jgi:fission process protein 1